MPRWPGDTSATHVVLMAHTTLDRPPLREDELHAAFDLSGVPRTAYIPLLATTFAIGLGLYLAVEPTKPWILLVLVEEDRMYCMPSTPLITCSSGVVTALSTACALAPV